MQRNKTIGVWVSRERFFFTVTPILLRLQQIPQFLDGREGTVKEAQAVATSHGNSFESKIKGDQSTGFDVGFTQMVELRFGDIRTSSGLCPTAQATTSAMALLKPVNKCWEQSSGEGRAHPFVCKQMHRRCVGLSTVRN